MRAIKIKLVITSIFVLIAPNLYATKLIKINKTKKLVIIDGGTATGFQKLSNVCFYEGTTKIACGIIKTVKEGLASVKLKNSSLFEKLKEGMEVKLEAPDPSMADKNQKPSSSIPISVSVTSSFPIINPIGYSNVKYLISTDGVSSVWTGINQVKSLGGGIELGLRLKDDLINLGIRGRYFIPKKILSDYKDTTKPQGETIEYYEQFSETVAKGSSFGSYADYYYLNFDWGVTNLDIGNGLDIDISTVKFTSSKKQQDTPNAEPILELGPLYEATSKLNAISLRTNILLSFEFGSLGIHFGTTLHVPLSQKNSLSILTNNDEFTISRDPTILESELKKALTHKAKPGAEIILAGNFTF